MKIKELFEDTKYSINNDRGRLKAQWKDDLEDEEGEGYIPEGYNKTVLEFELVEAKRIGKGDGDSLIKEFLNSPIAKSAELIFLDPNPSVGLFANSDLSDAEQIKKLKEYYRKYEFRNNPRSDRMWRVQKGQIEDHNLPT